MSEQAYETYMTEKLGKLPFCPGCGHITLIKALNKALVKLQIDPAKVVIVTDIGCIGLSDRHFITSAFHGLHGRSITYACGLKLARPDLHVINIMGDGAAGIGGTHLLNVARRNIGITLIIGNNFNYGMTGGQHSVTTPTDGLTATTPWGNVEGPMDLCGTAIAAGASWAYRTTTFDKELVDVLADAIMEPGFSMVDAWELCSAYYSPRNKIKKSDLFALLESHGLKTGLLVDKKREEYSIGYRRTYEEIGKKAQKTKPKIEVEFEHKVDRQIGIVIAGSAGQKIKSASTLFAQGGMYSGLETTQKDDYPITVMTGHSLAEIIFSPEQIDYTAIDDPDYFLAISEDGVKRAKKRIAALSEKCVLYAEESLELPETKAKVIRVPLVATAKTVSKLSIGIVGLAALLADSGLYPVEAFDKAIGNFQKKKIADINVEAVKAGVAMLEK
ncbi:MAG: 2-oxoacid:acceptor oxidoreductase family protein [Deltaproteobacteria bacterium]|nr:2-oxoacid:acceptor oxidoreductase family protein [Deltaproteobacteria bacterium]